MRITFILPLVNMSGGTKVVAIYAKALAEAGHIVRLISVPPLATPRIGKLKSWLKGDGWPNDPLPPKSHLDGSRLDHQVLDCWRPVVNKDVPNADVVIATWWETAEWVNALGSNKGAKVYFIQGHEIFPHLPVARCRATYHLPLHKIVVSRWLKQIMSSQYGDDDVDLVPNSVDRTQFFAAARGKQLNPTLGFLYSTGTSKGLDVTIAALHNMSETVPNLRKISFGIEYPNAALALPEDVEFFFSPPQDQIRHLYSRCDVWITASRNEGFNLPAMEAMACRTPVVATRTGWPEEAVKPFKNGMLVEIDDRIGLAQGTEWVLTRDDEHWRNLSSEAYATAASGSWQQSAEMFERALEHACCRSARAEIAGKSARPLGNRPT